MISETTRDQERHRSREGTYPCAAKDLGGLGAGQSRSEGVGYRVEGEDRANGVIDSLPLELEQQRCPAVTLRLLCSKNGIPRCQESGFKQRTDKGDSYCKTDIEG